MSLIKPHDWNDEITDEDRAEWARKSPEERATILRAIADDRAASEERARIRREAGLHAPEVSTATVSAMMATLYMR